jgi:hypothetical protein
MALSADPDPALVERFVQWLERRKPPWLMAVPHASAVAAEAWTAHRTKMPPPGVDRNALLWQKMYSAVGASVRSARAARRAPGLAVVQGERQVEPAALPADEVEALLRRRGVASRDAGPLAAWLTGTTSTELARRLGRPRKGVLTTLRRGRLALGLTAEEARALIGLARGEKLSDLAWGSWRPRAGAR